MEGRPRLRPAEPEDAGRLAELPQVPHRLATGQAVQERVAVPAFLVIDDEPALYGDEVGLALRELGVAMGPAVVTVASAGRGQCDEPPVLLRVRVHEIVHALCVLDARLCPVIGESVPITPPAGDVLPELIWEATRLHGESVRSRIVDWGAIGVRGHQHVDEDVALHDGVRDAVDRLVDGVTELVVRRQDPVQAEHLLVIEPGRPTEHVARGAPGLLVDLEDPIAGLEPVVALSGKPRLLAVGTLKELRVDRVCDVAARRIAREDETRIVVRACLVLTRRDRLPERLSGLLGIVHIVEEVEELLRPASVDTGLCRVADDAVRECTLILREVPEVTALLRTVAAVRRVHEDARPREERKARSEHVEELSVPLGEPRVPAGELRRLAPHGRHVALVRLEREALQGLRVVLAANDWGSVHLDVHGPRGDVLEIPVGLYPPRPRELLQRRRVIPEVQVVLDGHDDRTPPETRLVVVCLLAAQLGDAETSCFELPEDMGVEVEPRRAVLLIAVNRPRLLHRGARGVDESAIEVHLAEQDLLRKLP